MTPTAPDALYERALAGGALNVRAEDGPALPLDVARWLGPVTAADRAVLDRACGPVLDVGCGPGRHVRALVARGVFALGVDASPPAVRVARSRGAHVVECSVFDDLLPAGAWGAALLLDGSVGIGGCPMRLLRRVRELLAPTGRALVEVGPPGAPTRIARLRLEDDRDRSVAFPWALVGLDGLTELARAVGLRRVDAWCHSGRWFAELA
ncbi:MAG TPA: class I SAM-dependent methyltransferase [Capillimicrobium sp.]|nr:class I SAM-dependent methyltransferase [Capillimicrobium sp.]